jgi:hypothetical protein
MLGAIDAAAMPAGAAGQALALIAGGGLVILGHLRAPPGGLVAIPKALGAYPVGTGVAGLDRGLANDTVEIPVRGAEEPSARVAAADRFFLACVTVHSNSVRRASAKR